MSFKFKSSVIMWDILAALWPADRSTNDQINKET